ncbi:MAG: 3-deoxy-8-phosphooctulonate synthase [Candidatus Gastranaerophilales bacterium]|nr:3-deoxy-8-phosphooctulonate synthase [Candidatus Gastranaerophilales bacterium]
MKTIKLNNFEIGGDKLTILAGPCAMESKEISLTTAKKLKEICSRLDINFVFKTSFDKANRSSLTSYRGLGMDEGLKILSEIKKELNVPIVTDIHESWQAQPTAEVADIIQIPAFLCRQTDLLVAAAKTNKIINIKKGQFLSPYQMKSIAQKVIDSGNDKILITDRGTSFGYNNLVVDMRGVQITQDELNFPYVFDATHSVQIPGGHGGSSAGERKFVPLLAKSAVAAGAKVLFFEIHPNPECALCDGDNMLPLNECEKTLDICNKIFKLVN